MVKRKLEESDSKVKNNHSTKGDSNEPESRVRKPFTQGWQEEMTMVEALPIKQGKKVLKVKRAPLKSTNEDVEENIVDVSEDEADTGAEPDERKKAHMKQLERQVKRESIPLFFVERTPKEYIELQQLLAAICTSIVANPEKACMKVKKNDDGEKKSNEADDDDSPYQQYRVQDLLDIAGTSQDAQEVEMALLSAAVVFKDICPGYRIQATGIKDTSTGEELQLKKETKKLKEFELSLLRHYQRYLSLLDSFVQWGLGPVKTTPKTWEFKQELSIVAYKCQCELIKTLHHFNFRSQIITSILNRAVQQLPQVSEVAASTLTYLFQKDNLGELSFEIVTSLNKVLSFSRFTLPTIVMETFELVKITVHADQVKALQIHSKNAKKQRRKAGKDVEKEVEVGLMEADAEQDDFTRKRFQGNCLQELTLIYFRILKNGNLNGELLPTALHGLARLTHYIEIDTVNDLLSLLKHILELPVVNAPLSTKLLSVHCALKTLSGPGSELKLDDTPYFQNLLLVIAEIHKALNKYNVDNEHSDQKFNQWVSLMECIDMAFVQRRENRNELVEGIVRHLLIHALEQFQKNKLDLSRMLLILTHNVLLRYPKVKEVFLEEMHLNTPILLENTNITNSNKQHSFNINSSIIEDHAEDLAMKGLRDPLHGKGILQSNYGKTIKLTYKNKIHTVYAHCGTWAMIVLNDMCNTDANTNRPVISVLKSMGAKEFHPIMWRVNDVKKHITNDLDNSGGVIDMDEKKVQQKPQKQKQQKGGAQKNFSSKSNIKKMNTKNKTFNNKNFNKKNTKSSSNKGNNSRGNFNRGKK